MIDRTRRGWLVTITQAAVGLGVAGSIEADTGKTAALPAGVYRPSRDHLSHALMSAEQFHPIPPGCPTDYLRPSNGPFKPLFFFASEFPVIHRLTQLLLDDTSETGGVSQEVAEWIDLRASSGESVRAAAAALNPRYRDLAVAFYGSARVQQIENWNPANTCREGLAWVEDFAQKHHSKAFLELQPEQQIAILEAVSDQRPDEQAQNAGTRLFDFLKAEAIRGFYTSRVGLKELDFKGNAFYARSPGCDSQ
jgi:hypothetical protein